MNSGYLSILGHPADTPGTTERYEAGRDMGVRRVLAGASVVSLAGFGMFTFATASGAAVTDPVTFSYTGARLAMTKRFSVS